MPKVSVIIPTYNRKIYVQEAVESVLSQSYQDFEVIVIDDGSTDGTGDALKERFGDRIQYYWQNNQGESTARNYGISKAKGKYIALLDSDDLWEPEKLLKQVPLLELNTDQYVLAICGAKLIDGDGMILEGSFSVPKKSVDLHQLILANHLPSGGSTALIRKEALMEAGGFDQEIIYGEDWDLWIRLRRRGEFTYIDEELAFIRIHEGSQFHGRRAETLEPRLRAYLHIIHKALDEWPGRVPENLPCKAEANVYGEIGLLNYGIGNSQRGKVLLETAASLCPEFWADSKSLSIRLADALVASARVIKKSIKGQSRDLQEFIQYWPANVPQKRANARFLASEFYEHCFFLSAYRKDLGAAFYSFYHLAYFKPYALKNKGIWSLLYRLLFDSLRRKQLAQLIQRKEHKAALQQLKSAGKT